MRADSFLPTLFQLETNVAQKSFRDYNRCLSLGLTPPPMQWIAPFEKDIATDTLEGDICRGSKKIKGTLNFPSS
jgi:hypothetical protein